MSFSPPASHPEPRGARRLPPRRPGCGGSRGGALADLAPRYPRRAPMQVTAPLDGPHRLGWGSRALGLSPTMRPGNTLGAPSRASPRRQVLEPFLPAGRPPQPNGARVRRPCTPAPRTGRARGGGHSCRVMLRCAQTHHRPAADPTGS